MMGRNPIAVEPLEKRRYERTALQGSAVVTVGSGFRKRSFEVRLVNASMTGLCVAGDLGVLPDPDAPVTVEWSVPTHLSFEDAPETQVMTGQIVRENRTSSTPNYPQFGIRLTGLVNEQVELAKNASHRKSVAIVLFLLAALIAYLKSRNVISFWYQPIFQAYSLAAAAFVLSRIGLSFVYREPRDNGYLPAISVIIAAKNEEEHITESIENCFKARYPADLMEVLVIDDGSTDRTWDVLQDVQKRFPHLHCFRFEKNRGKRHGMALGATKAKGKILIFIDSDSNVEPEGFYRIVQPFADKRVGAVAGHTGVIVEEDNFLSKMEAVRYFVSQRVMKAAESVFNNVTCCPGPFSAYRRDAVMRVLPEWEMQRFFGTQATFGDDRSLTNFILRNYRVVYHAGARCATYVPRQWKVFFKQQLRWKKSWFRETTVAVRFMWQKHPATVLAYYGSVLITIFSPFIAIRALFLLPLMLGSFSFVPYVLGLLLVYGFFGLVYNYYTRASRWYYGLAFAVMYLCVLGFQNYYALLTVHKNHWGTR
jgi:hyaluronan synthase